MSRSTIIILLILVLIIGGIFLLAGIDTEVAPTRVEKAMQNETQAQ